MSWNLTQNTTVGANLGYSHGTETQTQIPPAGTNVITIGELELTDEIYDTYTFGVSSSYRLSQQTTVTLAYNHYRRESNDADRSYFNNRVSIGLRYQF